MTTLKSTQRQARLPKPGQSPEADRTALAHLNALKAMSINDLKAEWAKLFGEPAPNNSGPYLRMRLGIGFRN